MWDLTIPGDGDHDFYIDTEAADILVHNEDACGTGAARFVVDSEGEVTDLSTRGAFEAENLNETIMNVRDLADTAGQVAQKGEQILPGTTI